MSTTDIHLVTGGTGSIGRELVKHLISSSRYSGSVRVLSRNDSSQHELLQEIAPDDRHRVRFILGDVRAENAGRYMAGVTHIWHCAAVKHVIGAEYNADECVSINVQGTANMLTAAHHEAEKRQEPMFFTLLSTDKAADPSNIMGASKFCAERVVLGSSWVSPCLRRAVVRFGNVWNTRGSVFPTFCDNLRNGRQCLITAPSATRYLMSKRQAVAALLYAQEKAEEWSPCLCVPIMPKVTVQQIYDFAVEHVQPGGWKAAKVIGLQPGEKKHERLLSDYELTRITHYDEHREMFTLSERAQPMNHNDLEDDVLFIAASSHDAGDVESDWLDAAL